MSSYSFSTKRLTFVRPDKGSFPLDHEGVCKDYMMKYMDCLKDYQLQNTNCKTEIRNYLECRMDNGLMKREPWKKLGLEDSEIS